MDFKKTSRLMFAILATALTPVLPVNAASVVFSGKLDASQVVAPVTDADGKVIGSTAKKPDGSPISTSLAKGFATVTIDTAAKSITTDFSWSGLSGPADRAHLHDAPSGISRLEPPNDRFFNEVIADQYDASGKPIVDGTGKPVSSVVGGIIPCPFPTPGDGCAPAKGSLHDVVYLDATWFDPTGATAFKDFNSLLAAFKADGIFLDIHTDLYPGGEIRGQLFAVPEPETYAMLLAGLGLMGFTLRRRKQKPMLNRGRH